MPLVRIGLAVLALAVGAWFYLGVVQARDLSAATAVATSAQTPSPSRAAHASSLLDSAATLNPDIQVKLVRAQLAAGRGERDRAIAISEQAAREEPENVLTWFELARVAGTNRAALLLAFAHIKVLSPPVRSGR